MVIEGSQVSATHSGSATKSQTVKPVQASSVAGSHPMLESTAASVAVASWNLYIIFFLKLY